ncbi:hypothetical protein OB919_12460 [Halobacteria archaeon AArc-curdl1]|uniref:Uncharacterized protein n=1 Tax=Natronosalvus hydrolyticus TaxID=2979988 RepID=A0AAP2Z9E1_9EURY|nr:hypothetical protein [Halobacteria archaeon AArc-curdl1]
MQTLEVTDEQYAVIQRLRATMSEEVVGKYGFVREQDAVQYLIDTLEAATEDGELGDLEFDIEADSSGSTATDDVTAAVEAAIEDESQPEDVETVSYDEGSDDEVGDDDDSRVADEDPDDADEPTDDDPSDGADEGTDEDGAAAVKDADADDDEGGTEAVDAEDADESDEGDDDSGGGAADDDDMLNKMMSLLDTHDDKWEESPSADYRYRVDLPDGGTKDVQTKDDVRALLFKNY